jgi:GH25 family lysozyme M1 (1,4-beta-N-acetylmuramidase)
MRVRREILFILAALTFLASSVDPASGQTPSRAQRPPAARADRQAELLERMNASRAGFEQLLAAYEEQLRSQSAELARRRKLYDSGEVSRSFVMAAERDVADTRAHIIEVQQWIFEDDLVLEEALAREEILRSPALALGGYAESKTLIRFNGGAKWSLADSAKIEKFFFGRFARALPVSARGQTSAHTRMRFDHHEAMDVAVHPDSEEGRALMAHLRQAGIPFMAFRGRMAGSATGAHIHVGKPSFRIASP